MVRAASRAEHPARMSEKGSFRMDKTVNLGLTLRVKQWVVITRYGLWQVGFPDIRAPFWGFL